MKRNYIRLALHKHPKILIPLITILATGLIIVLVIKNMAAPATGTVTQTPLSEAEVKLPYSQPGSYDGQYVKFIYPAHYKKTPSKLTGDYLETATYSATNLMATNIAVGVRRGSIKDDSGNKYREDNPSLYHKTTTKFGTLYEAANGQEATYYLENDGLVATVSTTSTSNKDLSSITVFVASSLKWK